MKKTYDVKGMTCASCVSHVEKAVKSVQGIVDASANLLTNQVTVTGEFDEPSLHLAVKKAGYQIVTGAPQNQSGNDQEELQYMKKRLILSACFLLLLMYLAMGHMLGLPLPAIFDGAENAAIYILTQALLTAPILYLNRSYFSRGFSSLLHGTPNMDSLIALGSGAAVIYGIWAMYAVCFGMGHGNLALVEKYRMDLYFESAGTILTLVTLGKFLEQRSRRKTGAAIEKLVKLAPDSAAVLRGEEEILVPLQDVMPGDLVAVRPGQRVPVDGIIVEGASAFDESALTGESVPKDKEPGDPVMAASMCQTGYVVLKAGKVGQDTTLSQIIRLVSEAAATKAPIARMADRISGVFVPCVIGIALIALAAWLIAGQSFSFALTRAISVLVISCPCALGLATPVAIMVGTGKGAQMGVLLKSGEAIETLSRVTTIVLDKTGTLTQGIPTVTDVISFDDQLLMVARALEKGSEHPFARAVMEKTDGLLPPEVSDFTVIPGRGVRGMIHGKLALGGNAALMQECGIDPQPFSAAALSLADEGKTPLFFALDGKPLGVIACADVLKAGSREAVAEFQHLPCKVVMLTGDNERTARAIAKQAGIDQVCANVLPDDKERVIRELQASGERVAMVGDGINDAPALTRADVGIAIGAGTDIAMDAADVVLMNGDLRDVVTAFRLSAKTLKTIRMGLFWALFYNSICIPVAAGVLYPAFGILLSPMFASAAMSLSSVCVCLNALRLNRFKPEKREAGEKIGFPKAKQETCVLRVEGMMCEHCQHTVETALRSVPGVLHVSVSLEKEQAVIVALETADKAQMIRVVEDEDYTAAFLKGNDEFTGR